MFGYVMADLTALGEEEKARYQGCYCGLCRRLGALCGQASRLTLNYDLTFLILLLESVYGEEGGEAVTNRRCVAHPTQAHPSWHSRWTDYGAYMNLALTWYKLLDDWKDDRKVSARLAAAALGRKMPRIEGMYPRQCQSMARELDILAGLERRGICDPDGAAGSFGRLMGELFVPDPEDPWSGDLRQLGESLGQFIYLLDAGVDLKEDLLQEKYNPLVGMVNLELEPLLTMVLAPGAEALERLPLKWDQPILENIIYSGVWSQYRRWKQTREDVQHE